MRIWDKFKKKLPGVKETDLLIVQTTIHVRWWQKHMRIVDKNLYGVLLHIQIVLQSLLSTHTSLMWRKCLIWSLPSSFSVSRKPSFLTKSLICSLVQLSLSWVSSAKFASWGDWASEVLPSDSEAGVRLAEGVYSRVISALLPEIPDDSVKM